MLHKINSAQLGCNYTAESTPTTRLQCLCLPGRTSASSYIMLWHYGNKAVDPVATSVSPWADASCSDAIISLPSRLSQCPTPQSFAYPAAAHLSGRPPWSASVSHSLGLKHCSALPPAPLQQNTPSTKPEDKSKVRELGKRELSASAARWNLNHTSSPLIALHLCQS